MTSSTPNATASIAVQSPTPTPLQAQLQAHAIRFVRFMWCDNANVIRAKAVHTAALGDYADGAGVGMAAAQMALPVMYDALAPGSGLTPAGEVHMMADWPTLTPCPMPAATRASSPTSSTATVRGHIARAASCVA